MGITMQHVVVKMNRCFEYVMENNDPAVSSHTMSACYVFS